MQKYMIRLPYVEGIKLLCDNPKIVLSKENKDAYSGYSDIFFDEPPGDLKESYYVYDDYGFNDGIKEDYHIVNINTKFLYVDGTNKNNILLYIKMIWDFECNWKSIKQLLTLESPSDVERAIIDYVRDIYYTTIKYMTEKDFDMQEKDSEDINNLF